jgi:Zn-dependent peptidase ImmA (M78 family)
MIQRKNKTLIKKKYRILSKQHLMKLLEMGASPRGGYTAKQLAIFGIKWKKTLKPWKKDIIDKWYLITSQQVTEFLQLRSDR